MHYRSMILPFDLMLNQYHSDNDFHACETNL